MLEGTRKNQNDKTDPRYVTSRAFLKDCPHDVAEIFEYWSAKCDGRRMPRRAEIAPEDFVSHLPGILLVDVEGLDESGVGIFRYRVVGTEEVALRGHDPTGKLVQDGFLGPSPGDVLACYDYVRREKSFIYDPLEYRTPDGRWRADSTIFLPLSENGETVTQIMVYSKKRGSKAAL